jgi:hypothetical protein
MHRFGLGVLEIGDMVIGVGSWECHRMLAAFCFYLFIFLDGVGCISSYSSSSKRYAFYLAPVFPVLSFGGPQQSFSSSCCRMWLAWSAQRLCRRHCGKSQFAWSKALDLHGFDPCISLSLSLSLSLRAQANAYAALFQAYVCTCAKAPPAPQSTLQRQVSNFHFVASSHRNSHLESLSKEQRVLSLAIDPIQLASLFNPPQQQQQQPPPLLYLSAPSPS